MFCQSSVISVFIIVLVGTLTCSALPMMIIGRDSVLEKVDSSEVAESTYSNIDSNEKLLHLCSYYIDCYPSKKPRRVSSNLFHGIPKFGKRLFSSAFSGIPKFGWNCILLFCLSLKQRWHKHHSNNNQTLIFLLPFSFMFCLIIDHVQMNDPT